MEMTIIVPRVVNVDKIDVNGELRLILEAESLDIKTHQGMEAMVAKYVEDKDYAEYVVHCLIVKLMRANLMSSIRIDDRHKS